MREVGNFNLSTAELFAPKWSPYSICVQVTHLNPIYLGVVCAHAGVWLDLPLVGDGSPFWIWALCGRRSFLGMGLGSSTIDIKCLLEACLDKAHPCMQSVDECLDCICKQKTSIACSSRIDGKGCRETLWADPSGYWLARERGLSLSIGVQERGEQTAADTTAQLQLNSGALCLLHQSWCQSVVVHTGCW